MSFQHFESSFFLLQYLMNKKKQSTEIQLIASLQCRPTGIRTPTGGTKNRSATVTPWVCRLLWCKCTAFFLSSKFSSKKNA